MIFWDSLFLFPRMDAASPDMFDEEGYYVIVRGGMNGKEIVNDRYPTFNRTFPKDEERCIGKTGPKGKGHRCRYKRKKGLYCKRHAPESLDTLSTTIAKGDEEQVEWDMELDDEFIEKLLKIDEEPPVEKREHSKDYVALLLREVEKNGINVETTKSFFGNNRHILKDMNRKIQGVMVRGGKTANSISSTEIGYGSIIALLFSLVLVDNLGMIKMLVCDYIMPLLGRRSLGVIDAPGVVEETHVHDEVPVEQIVHQVHVPVMDLDIDDRSL